MSNLIELDNFTPLRSTRPVGTSGWLAVTSMATIVWSGLRRRHQCRRAIAELAALDDRILKDIGLFRPDIERAVRYGRDKAGAVE
jgi:uncharacterized protein YjiS (DUF1127 family)